MAAAAIVACDTEAPPRTLSTTEYLAWNALPALALYNGDRGDDPGD